MAKQKVAVTLDPRLLTEVDDLVASGVYPNRSQAIEAALVETLARRARTRLIRECDRLDPDEERALADEGLGAEGVPLPSPATNRAPAFRSRSNLRRRCYRSVRG